MEVRIDRALILAHAGNYLQAFQVLMPRDLLPTQHEELDVVARLYVKTGELNKARICLKEAITKAPHIKAYRAALEVLDLYIEKEIKTRKAAKGLGIITGIACIVGFLSFFAVECGLPYVTYLTNCESTFKKIDAGRPTNFVELPKSTKPLKK
jgi:hypothetical protein